MPLETTIGIPIIIFYIIKLQCLKFGLWVVISNLQTCVRWDLSTKDYRSSAMVIEIEDIYEEN